MRTPRLPLALLLAGATLAAGCGGSGGNDSAERFDDPQERAVATAVEEFADDVASRDYDGVCSDRLAPAIVDELDAKRKPGGCTQAMEDSLRDVSSAEVDVRDVTVRGSRASAVIEEEGTSDSEPRTTLALVKDGEAWKVQAIQPAPGARR